MFIWLNETPFEELRGDITCMTAEGFRRIIAARTGFGGLQVLAVSSDGEKVAVPVSKLRIGGADFKMVEEAARRFAGGEPPKSTRHRRSNYKGVVRIH